SLGTVGSPLAIASSTSSFHDFSCSPPTPKDPPICRWGDYAGASPDPNGSHVVWATEQYSSGTRWLTRNFAIQVLAGGPTARLSVATSPTLGGPPIKFDGSASTDSLAAITSYAWDLDGNGTFETKTGGTPSVTHTFHLVGKRRVRLRVIDANGDASDAAVTLTLLKPPPTAKCKAATKKRKHLAARAGRLVGLAGSPEPAARTRPRRPRPPKPGMDDTTLTRKVESEIFRIRGVAKGKIDVNAAGGVVWVRGEGRTPALIKRIETKAASIPEVKRVENLLHLPKTPAPSRTDTPASQR